MKNELMIFEESQVIMIVDAKGNVLFELYSTGMALGYINRRKNSIGKEYISPYKSRIDKNIKNTGITVFSRGVEKYIDLNGLRKFISISNTTNKSKFIEFLQEKGYLHKEEVFEYSRKENVLMDSIVRVLKPIGYTLETQKVDANYRLDGYIPELDLVIEYDENNHSQYDSNKEQIRENYIKNNYNHLIRLTDEDDLMTNIGKVMNKIMEVA